MSDTSSLMINNRAEIQDSISEQSLTDKDSTAGIFRSKGKELLYSD